MTALSRRQFANNSSSTLAAELLAAGNTVQVSAGEGTLFPDPTALTDGHYFCTLEDLTGATEIVKVTARAGDTFTVDRAEEGTVSPASFPAGTTRFEIRATAGLLAEWLLPSMVRYLAAGLGLTFEGPSFPGTATDIAVVRGIEDPARLGSLLLEIGSLAGGDADVRVHAEGRDVMIQDVYYPDGQGAVGQTLELVAVDRAQWADKVVEIPSGTRMLFHQSAAPSGWTQDVSGSYNQRVLYVTNSAAGGSNDADGGTWSHNVGLNASKTGGHTLRANEAGVGNHDHSLQGHVHSMEGHSHSLQGHSHSLQGHTHNMPHTHDMQHAHDYFRTSLGSGNQQGFDPGESDAQFDTVQTGPSSTPNTGGPSVSATEGPSTGFTGGPSTGFTGAPNTANTGVPSASNTGLDSRDAISPHDHPGSTISSNATWRPANTVVIICTKN